MIGGTRRLDGLQHGGRGMASLWLVLATVMLLFSVGDGRLVLAATLRPVTVSHAVLPDDGLTTAAATTSPGRPDFRVAFTRLDVGQAGDSLSYTVQVWNEGSAGGAVRVTTMLPPEFSNVRVNAPGFACSRQFTAGGSDAGTLVACTRSELADGAAAEVSVEANAPATPGSYRLVATADPRDEVPEADEGNNQVATVVTLGA